MIHRERCSALDELESGRVLVSVVTSTTLSLLHNCASEALHRASEVKHAMQCCSRVIVVGLEHR